MPTGNGALSGLNFAKIDFIENFIFYKLIFQIYPPTLKWPHTHFVRRIYIFKISLTVKYLKKWASRESLAFSGNFPIKRLELFEATLIKSFQEKAPFFNST